MADESKKVRTALDLALERLGAADPGPSLSAEQKSKLSELEREHALKLRETEFVFDQRVGNALREGDFATAEKIRAEKIEALRALKAELEAAKEKVRQES